MKTLDSLKFSAKAIVSHRLRSFLTLLGIAIGIASVILLTSIGTGIQQFIISEFTQFGTNLLGIVPGKTTTMGMSGAVISNVRPLTIEDEQAMKRVPQVVATVPVVQGNAAVEAGQLQRRTTILGVGAFAPQVWQIPVEVGNFLPDDDPRAARSYVVLGSKVRNELFSEANPLGAIVRIGGSRFRVIGVMASKGQILGFDLDDAVYIPAAKALELFNRESLMEIDVLYSETASSAVMVKRVETLLSSRHGHNDFTITSQDQMVSVLDDVLEKLTLAIGTLGGISLLVGGVGILTIMTIAVRERTVEIGLLRSLGATRKQILFLFLEESVFLSFSGGAAGLVIGWGGSRIIHLLVPGLPTKTSVFYVVLSLALSIAIGLFAGVMPARLAARLDPQEALRTE